MASSLAQNGKGEMASHTWPMAKPWPWPLARAMAMAMAGSQGQGHGPGHDMNGMKMEPILSQIQCTRQVGFGVYASKVEGVGY
jgi:hypothetical protein